VAKKVFVPHQIAKDIEEARKKADELVVIVDGKFNPFYIGDLFKTVEAGVTSIDTEGDFIAPMGSSLVNFLTGVAIGMKQPKKVKLLIFDNTGGRNYKEVVLKLKG
jgi:hypothetical protein